MMILPPSSPHPLDIKFKHLSIGILTGLPHVVFVALNRPGKRNAINSLMWKEIGQAFSELGSLGDGCRCILLLGAGKAFSAGIDILDTGFFLRDDVNDVARRGIAFRSQIIEMQQCFTLVETCPIPVVAAIHGPCIGAGIDLVCCADVRLCSSSTTFSIREVRLGLAADVGTLQRFPKIVGYGSCVRELCLTGEDFDSQEALRIGFVSRTLKNEDDLILDAIALCKRIVIHSPVAVMGTKMSLTFSRDHTVMEGLDHIASHNAMALMTDDMAASFGSVARGEEATFHDLPKFSRL
jgi:Delta3,5-Delta2,4-dienoyl-CoA isomerase